MKGLRPDRPCRRCGHFEWVERLDHWECAKCGMGVMRSDFLGKPSKGSEDVAFSSDDQSRISRQTKGPVVGSKAVEANVRPMSAKTRRIHVIGAPSAGKSSLAE